MSELEKYKIEREIGDIEMILEDGELRFGESGDGQVEVNDSAFSLNSRDTSMISASGASSQIHGLGGGANAAVALGASSSNINLAQSLSNSVAPRQRNSNIIRR